ncbi:Crp/Fnr family transcriptional regulator [Fusibacter tunisiensis]|uniref:CRP/FNR family transcriptional regulator n=1 Tax=Fusibacter tunisiensis TaxID=1008308 RepID=A0ABS2MS49_9FIRM|nr:Crp/Fnr family transcriptional regulator [Fusibacter tunisiensis]MBM7562127.1 CRP/FNR family transcriptional regulator [Fusibacter tunisiensis]
MKHTFHLPTGCASCGHKLCAKKVSLFSNLSDDQLHTLINLVERKSYKKGDTIVHLGLPFDRLYIVNQGSLKVSTFNEEGKAQILYILNEGDTFGELSLLKSMDSPYEINALRACHLCTIPKNAFDAYLKENPEIIFAILESAHEKITSLEKLVGAIATNDADTRLRFLIHRLMLQNGQVTPNGVLIKFLLTREDMANFVGVTRETISRKLSTLSQEGILELKDNKQLLILNEDYFMRS